MEAILLGLIDELKARGEWVAGCIGSMAAHDEDKRPTVEEGKPDFTQYQQKGVTSDAITGEALQLLN